MTSEFQAYLLGVAIGLGPAALMMGSRVRRWILTRGGPRRDFCETCNRQPRRLYHVFLAFDDDADLGGQAHSFMAATYCRRHRPTGARRKPNPRA